MKSRALQAGRLLRATRTLDVVVKPLAGPSRHYETSSNIATGTPTLPVEPAKPFGSTVQYTLMGTPSPIPRLVRPGSTMDEGMPVELRREEPTYQFPPMLDKPSRGYLEPVPLPKTHGIPVAILHMRGYHVRLLDLFIHFALHSAISLGIPTTKAFPLKTVRRLWTVIKGPFVHKKSQQNFIRLTHKRAIRLYDANPDVVTVFFKYLEAHAVAGVGVRTIRFDRAPLGFAGDQMRKAMEAGVVNKKQRKLLKKLSGAKFASSQPQAGPSMTQTMLGRILKQEGDLGAKIEHTPVTSAREVEVPTITAQAQLAPEQTNEKPVNAEQDVPVELTTPGDGLDVAPLDVGGEPVQAETASAAASAAASTETASASEPEPEPEPAPEPVASAAPQTSSSSTAPSTASEASISAAHEEPSPSLEVQEPDPSTAGPPDFAPEAKEDAPSAELAPKSGNPQIDSTTAQAATEPDPSTAGPADFKAEPSEESIATDTVVANSTSAVSAAEVPSEAPVQAEAEPSTAGPADFKPETSEVSASEPAPAEKTDVIEAAAVPEQVDTSSAEPAAVSEEAEPSPSTAGPPAEEKKKGKRGPKPKAK